MTARTIIRRPGRQLVFLPCMVMVGLVLLVALIGLRLATPWLRQMIDMANQKVTSANVRQIALAMYNYHDVYGELPPPYVADEYGNPMHSWRVLILPFLESSDVYSRYDFSEPWDGPNNSLLFDDRPSPYKDPRMPVDDGRRTSIQVISGAGAIFDPTASGVSFKSVTDGLMGTVLVIENCAEPVIWTKPDDTSPEDFLAGKAIGDVHGGEAILSMADGQSTTYRKSDLPQAKRWITRAAGD
ncbi:DUF1559 domain-containing protein [Blastopirellula marina]|uniref:DUF1559 domain-containing protein n=1 Tax=Blastopirellula marina TaxID=124 RepID=A0A2S8FT41_9BACT|nr:DUF1559 domain-containing protein [Blastopirellula marina]PQO35348.1 hypothetical protein C5Y98_13340 [Blastopirellula marina]PTL43988.1 DUF1559 domain-containing protein [Blastopirellula marina]